MPDFILIDIESGHVLGDTRGIGGEKQYPRSPVSAALILDECLEVYLEGGSAFWVEHGPDYVPAPGEDGYHVYRVLKDEEEFPYIEDGKHPEAIAAVERECEKVAVLTRGRPGARR